MKTYSLYRHRSAVLIAIFIALIILAAVRVLVGSTSWGWPQDIRVRDYRLFRLGIACVVGASLATSGVALQALLRNALAEPFILGLSTGAGVGIMGLTLIGRTFDLTLGAHYGAMIGAALTLTIVFMASRRQGVIDPLGLLLIGVVLSTINGGIILLLNYLPHSEGLWENVAKWMVGYIQEGVSPTVFMGVALLSGVGISLLLVLGRAMDVATLSDDEAQSVGVNLKTLRALLFIIASILAAGAVILAGPIAFVGLICPHIVRMLIGPRHRPLLIGAAAMGAALIIVADMLSASLKLVLDRGLMPLGVFTAILGGISFLWILRPKLGREI